MHSLGLVLHPETSFFAQFTLDSCGEDQLGSTLGIVADEEYTTEGDFFDGQLTPQNAQLDGSPLQLDIWSSCRSVVGVK